MLQHNGSSICIVTLTCICSFAAADVHACYRLQKAIPEVAHIIQASLNVDARNEQTEMETLLDMVRAVEIQTTTGGEIDWDKVLSAVSHNLGAVTKYAKVLLAYVKVTPAELIYELGAFYKANSSDDGPARHMGVRMASEAVKSQFWEIRKVPIGRQCMLQSKSDGQWQQACRRLLQACGDICTFRLDKPEGSGGPQTR